MNFKDILADRAKDAAPFLKESFKDLQKSANCDDCDSYGECGGGGSCDDDCSSSCPSGHMPRSI